MSSAASASDATSRLEKLKRDYDKLYKDKECVHDPSFPVFGSNLHTKLAKVLQGEGDKEGEGRRTGCEHPGGKREPGRWGQTEEG